MSKIPEARREYWRKTHVALLGGGSWGTVLAQRIAENVAEVRLWVRDEETARAMSATRHNPQAVPELQLHERVKAMAEAERIFEGGVEVVVWALPASACRTVARELAPLFRGSEILLHASKGLEEGSLKRISQVLREELPLRRVGVISGPNLATEMARGEPAATVVASAFPEVVEAGRALLESRTFTILGSHDVAGVEWAGALKNVLAIAAGALDAAGLGANARAWLLTRGLKEVFDFAQALRPAGGKRTEAQVDTILGPAGMGDLIATCGSPLSRNYQVGFQRAKGKPLAEILGGLGSTAEGVETARRVVASARALAIRLPVCESVVDLLDGEGGTATFVAQVFAPAVGS